MSIGRGLLAVRPGEGRLATLLAALFALVEMGRGLGEIALDTLFLRRVGPDALPLLYVGLGIVSLVMVVGFGAGIGALRRRPFLVALLAAFAATLLAARIVMGAGSSVFLGVAWVTVFAIGAVLATLVWSVAGTTLDMRQAKRLFPICTSAAIGGGFVGTLLAGPVGRVVGIENLLVLDAALLVLAAVVTAALTTQTPRPDRAPGRVAAGRSLAGHLRAGFDEVRRSPLMRLVAAAYVLFSVLQFSVTFPFMRAMTEAFPEEADLATTLGLVSAGVTALSFLASITIANRFYARFGIATAALLLPIVYLAGFGLWLVGFSLATAIAVRVAQQVTQRGISNAAWSAMYNVMPAARRPQVLAFMDGVPGQIGISLSGVVLAALAASLGAQPIFIMGLLTAAVCTWVVLLVRRRYGAALVRTLRAGLAEQVLEGGPGLSALGRGSGVTAELRAALGAVEPGTRRLAVELLAHLDGRAGLEAATAALSDGDAAVRITALRSLVELDLSAAAVGARTLADDAEPRVRAEAAVALAAAGDSERAAAIATALAVSPTPGERAAGARAAACLGPGAVGMLEAALADASPTVRAEAAAALASLRNATGSTEDESARILEALRGALDDEAPAVRTAAGRALGGRPGGPLVAAEVLRHGSERAQAAALLALGRDGADAAALESTVRDWAIGQVERAMTLRRDAAALAAQAGEDAVDGQAPRWETPGFDQPGGDAADYLRTVVEGRGREVEDRLLAAVAILGAPEANGPIRRSLRSSDADTRAQAIEALEAIGDPRLGRALARLLDADGAPPLPAGDVLRRLATDDDPWIRRLAVRASADRLRHAWRALAELAASDPDPDVRAAIAAPGQPGGGPMPDTDRTLGEIDRMLFLRRVPLFAELAPEDLQRLAATATERVYAAGEALVVEGDVGDELFVIVEGRVRVVRIEAGVERLLRTYEAGDHIGELAVLRDRPRAATVVAESDGVRGLVIGGEGLRAILRERPEAAMAMLATLAERLSVQ